MTVQIRVFVCTALLAALSSLCPTGGASGALEAQSLPEAGGPAADSGAIAIPRRSEPPEPPPILSHPREERASGSTLHLDSSEVTLEAAVLVERAHRLLPGLKAANFRIYEDGVVQKTLSARPVEAPITALLLCDDSAASRPFLHDMRNAAQAFVAQLRPEDYAALMSFDQRSHLLLDFTHDKRRLEQAIANLDSPGYSDTALYDALYEALDRLSRIEGRKYVILIASGLDTFSRLTPERLLEKIRATPELAIFTLSTGGALRSHLEEQGGLQAQLRDMDFLQADNRMRAYAELSGGLSFFPRFDQEAEEIFTTVNAAIRSNYRLVYRPTNLQQDGGYRKLRVELTDELGQPLRILDRKGRPLPYRVLAREGYRARPEVE